MSDKEKIYNAADPAQIEDADQTEAIELETRKKDLKEVLSTDAGLRFFKRLIEEVGFLSVSFSLTDTDPLKVAFKEGKKQVILKLLAEIAEASPKSVAKLILK